MARRVIVVTASEVKQLRQKYPLRSRIISLSDGTETAYREVTLTLPPGEIPPPSYLPFAIRMMGEEYPPQQAELDCALLTAYARRRFGSIRVAHTSLSRDEKGRPVVGFYQDSSTPFWVAPSEQETFAVYLNSIRRDGSQVLISTLEITPLLLSLVGGVATKHPEIDLWYGPKSIDFGEWPSLLKEVFVPPSDPRFHQLLLAYGIRPWTPKHQGRLTIAALSGSSLSRENPDGGEDQREMVLSSEGMDDLPPNMYYRGEAPFTRDWLFQAWETLLDGRIPILTIYEAIPLGFSSVAIGLHAARIAFDTVNPFFGDISPSVQLLDYKSVPEEEIRFDFDVQTWSASQVLRIDVPVNSRQMFLRFIEGFPNFQRFRMQTFEYREEALSFFEKTRETLLPKKLPSLLVYDNHLYAVTWLE